MAIDIYKAPVTYSVPTNTPIRIAGSKDPPFRIINLETEVTVWLSNNAGLKASQGTPLNPGTSLLWVTPTELFAIAEGSRSASIILTTEIEDWQPDPAAIATAIVNSGVILIDNPVSLFNTSLSAGNSRSTGFIDISRYQSVSLELAETVASGTANDSVVIEFSNDGTNVSMSKTVETFDITPAIGSTWRAAIPCHGKFIRIRSLTGTNYSLRLFGSYRAKQHIEQSMIDYNGGVTTDFYNDFISSFPAGNGIIVTFGPWYGEIEISGSFIIAPPITAGNLVNTITRRNTSTGVFNHSIKRLPITQPLANLSPNLWDWGARFAADGSVYQYQFTNNHTAALTSWAARIAPVSGYGAVA